MVGELRRSLADDRRVGGASSPECTDAVIAWMWSRGVRPVHRAFRGPRQRRSSAANVHRPACSLPRNLGGGLGAMSSAISPTRVVYQPRNTGSDAGTGRSAGRARLAARASASRLPFSRRTSRGYKRAPTINRRSRPPSARNPKCAPDPTTPPPPGPRDWGRGKSLPSCEFASSSVLSAWRSAHSACSSGESAR